MQEQRLGFTVRIDIRGFARTCSRFGHNAHTTLGADHIFYKKSCLAHHGPPPGFVPADRSIRKDDLKMPIIDLTRHDFIRKARADAIDADRA